MGSPRGCSLLKILDSRGVFLDKPFKSSLIAGSLSQTNFQFGCHRTAAGDGVVKFADIQPCEHLAFGYPVTDLNWPFDHASRHRKG